MQSLLLSGSDYKLEGVDRQSSTLWGLNIAWAARNMHHIPAALQQHQALESSDAQAGVLLSQTHLSLNPSCSFSKGNIGA